MTVHAAAIPQESVGIEDSDQQQDHQSKLYDEVLADDLYKDYSSQNQIAIQVVLALSSAGVGYGLEVRDAYAFFAKEKIDTEKFIKDPVYRAQISKYAEHLNFWEKGAIEKGTSKLGTVLEGANKAIKDVEGVNNKLVAFKEDHIGDYTSELQNLYGLDKKEIDALVQRAKYAIHKNPQLSIQDLVQTEAQAMARDRIKDEVGKKAKSNNEKLSKDEKNKRIQALTDEKSKAFTDSNKIRTLNDFEKKFQNSLTNNCSIRLDDILSTSPPAIATPPPQTGAPATPPISIPSPPSLSPMSQMSPLPISMPRFFPNLPSFSLPKLPNISFPSGLSNAFSGIGDGIRSGLGNMFKSGGGLSKGLSGLANLAKGALPRLASFALPPLGAALTALTALDALTGGLITKGAAVLVGGVAAIVIGLPLIGMVSMFSGNTGSNPLTITVPDNNLQGWYEFDKQFLSMETDNQKDKLGVGGANSVTWQHFEKDNLSPLKQYLSLESSK